MLGYIYVYILGEKTLTSFWSFDIISSVISEADHGVGNQDFGVNTALQQTFDARTRRPTSRNAKSSASAMSPIHALLHRATRIHSPEGSAVWNSSLRSGLS